MKITEAQRIKMAFRMIDDIAANESIMHKGPVVEALDEIYRIAHTMGAPKCRKNHANWIEPIDAAIRAGERNKI